MRFFLAVLILFSIQNFAFAERKKLSPLDITPGGIAIQEGLVKTIIIEKIVDTTGKTIIETSTEIGAGGFSLNSVGGLDLEIRNDESVNLTKGDVVYITTRTHNDHRPGVFKVDSSLGVHKKTAGIVVSDVIAPEGFGKIRVYGIAEAKVVGTPVVGDVLRASTLGGEQKGKFVVDNSPASGVKTWVAISTPNAQGLVRVIR